MREFVMPYMPTRWFVAAAHELQSGSIGRVWLASLAGLFGLGLAGLWAAALLFARRLGRGVRT
jgi:hypothetical protein